jgi:hypothetical protein
MVHKGDETFLKESALQRGAARVMSAPARSLGLGSSLALRSEPGWGVASSTAACAKQWHGLKDGSPAQHGDLKRP